MCRVLAHRTLSFTSMRCQRRQQPSQPWLLAGPVPCGGKGGKAGGRSGPTLRPCRYWMNTRATAHAQQMAGVAQCRARHMLLEHAGCKNKGDVACEAMDALTKDRAEQLEAKRFCHQMWSEFAQAETNCEKATENILEKADALDWHVKTATMRAESLAITRDHCNKTLCARREEAQDRMNASAGQLSAAVSSISELTERCLFQRSGLGRKKGKLPPEPP